MNPVRYEVVRMGQLGQMMKSSDKAFTPPLLILSHLWQGWECRVVNKNPLRKSRPKEGGAGFTLIELLLTFSILAFCLCGILLTYINMFLLADLSRDLTQVTNLMQAKMEEIKKENFNDIDIGVSSRAFDANLRFENEPGYDSNLKKGIITAEVITMSYSDLKRVRLISSFKSRGRVIGEDKNLDGDLDAGEDTLIANNRLDSPVEAVTLVASVK